MADYPIIFCAHMVRALIAGRKTQTRRVLCSFVPDRDPPHAGPYIAGHKAATWTDSDGMRVRYPGAKGAATGDRLYVWEAWRVGAWRAEHFPRGDGECNADIAVDYLADGFARRDWLRGDKPEMMLRLMNQSRKDASLKSKISDGCAGVFQWHPGQSPCRYRNARFMPRWASRLTLTVTDVRVHRLQDISEQDAWAEGCKPGEFDDNGNPFPADEPHPKGGTIGWDCARDWYADLWDSLHGPDAWDLNPWVVALTFAVERRNIDARGVADG